MKTGSPANCFFRGDGEPGKGRPFRNRFRFSGKGAESYWTTIYVTAEEKTVPEGGTCGEQSSPTFLAPESREAEIKAFVEKLRKIIDFAQKKMESDQKLN